METVLEPAMSDAKYLKCPCEKCGGPIEFPAAGLGVGVNCPHCGQRTTLFAPDAVVGEASPGEPLSTAALPPTPEADGALAAESHAGKGRGRARVVAVGIVLVALGGAGAGTFYHWKNRRHSQSKPVSLTSFKTSEVVSAASDPAPAPPPTPTTLKSIDDLKVGAITLEKAKSGSLVYAVGVLKNDSDYARYGVKIELDLSDAKGGRASKATDYTQVIDPRKEWRFRALILDSKAVSAKLAKITEDE
jgi:hypothetical protein